MGGKASMSHAGRKLGFTRRDAPPVPLAFRMPRFVRRSAIGGRLMRGNSTPGTELFAGPRFAVPPAVVARALSFPAAPVEVRMIDWPDAVLRLTAAAAVGAAIGLDREARGKPTGVRTLSIVALGSALAVLLSEHPSGVQADASSRVIQGVLTGIGFLGAGVILRRDSGDKVRGLTTAAAIWFTACIGMACGLGAWPLVVTAAVLVVLILTLGKRLERLLVPQDNKDEKHPPGSA